MAKKKFWTDKDEDSVDVPISDGRSIMQDALHVEQLVAKSMPNMRTFDTGATRDSDTDKPEFIGFISPEAWVRFGDYMHDHRFQADGTKRASANWRKGIPRAVYIESLMRHMMDLWQFWWMEQDGQEAEHKEVEDALCAILFNTQGFLHEYLKGN